MGISSVLFCCPPCATQPLSRCSQASISYDLHLQTLNRRVGAGKESQQVGAQETGKG